MACGGTLMNAIRLGVFMADSRLAGAFLKRGIASILLFARFRICCVRSTFGRTINYLSVKPT